ncbi:hypothetical protein NEILACOT_03011 [Neisseria lactamica ATCC 23970]|uniref:Uncharacterized protein n=1 Tax=Neisseria lactamica ATCC 23970 TaxID=546265 RepID=D0W674_NEILA|nr:hypothetical protein NEILACOT_03011 [Neisseria lactamica ATCC 23970]
MFLTPYCSRQPAACQINQNNSGKIWASANRKPGVRCDTIGWKIYR